VWNGFAPFEPAPGARNAKLIARPTLGAEKMIVASPLPVRAPWAMVPPGAKLEPPPPPPPPLPALL